MQSLSSSSSAREAEVLALLLALEALVSENSAILKSFANSSGDTSHSGALGAGAPPCAPANPDDIHTICRRS